MNKLLVVAASLLASLSFQIAAQPLPAGAFQKSKPTGAATASEKTYEQAKAEMKPNLYATYRILDRIMSANAAVTQKASIGIRSLDDSSCKKMLGDSPLCSVATELPDVKKEDSFLIWALQVAAASEGAPNAYASSKNNRITINTALLETLSDDIEAQACVVSHELAHIEKQHSAAKQEALQTWNDTAAGKIDSAIKNAHKAQKSGQFWSAVAMIANATSAGLNSGMGNYGAAASANFNNQLLAARLQSDNAAGNMFVAQMLQLAQSQAPSVFTALKGMEGLSASYASRTMKDVKVYLDEVSTKMMDLSRKHELEADQTAVEYLSKAGINPDSCNRVITALHRGEAKQPTDKMDSHPGEEERKRAIQEAIEINAAAYRRAKTQLAKPGALPYRYDSQLELATIYPRGQQPSPINLGSPASVDAFLGR